MATVEVRSPHFFKVILPDTLQNGSIEFPQGFLKKYGKCLPKYACLEVPTGAMWKVELKRSQGRVWLHRGWQDFIEHCSIKAGYFVVFRFDGGSFFHVFIFDTTTSEIDYTVSPSCTDRQVNFDQSKDQEVEVEDNEVDDDQEDENRNNDDDGDDGSCETSVRRPPKPSKFTGEDQVREDSNRPLQRAREFQSPHPYFFISMKPSYFCSGCYLHIPAGHAKRYFLEKENNGIRLIGADGRAWLVKYSARIRPTCQVKLIAGWSKFAKENHLRAGDVCVFELIESTPMTYKVTILRVADDVEIPEKATPKKPAKDADAMYTMLQRGKAFKSNKPHFMIRISQTYKSHKGYANIPTAHTRRYFKDARRGENVVVFHGSNGRSWPVFYHVTASDQDRAKLRSGWTSFVSNNQLEAGDVCVFEMIGGKAKDYKVTILRVADYA